MKQSKICCFCFPFMNAVRINVPLLLTDFTYAFFDGDLACFKTCCLFLRPGEGDLTIN